MDITFLSKIIHGRKIGSGDRVKIFRVKEGNTLLCVCERLEGLPEV